MKRKEGIFKKVDSVSINVDVPFRKIQSTTTLIGQSTAKKLLISFQYKS